MNHDEILDGEDLSSIEIDNHRSSNTLSLVLVSLVIYMLSLSFKAYCLNGDCTEYQSGLACVLIGVIALIDGGAALVWLGNPLLWLSWITARINLKVSMLLSGLGLLIALSFMLFDGVLINEAGHNKMIIGYSYGYWLWLVSFIVMVCGNYLLIYQSRRIDAAAVDGKLNNRS